VTRAADLPLDAEAEAEAEAALVRAASLAGDIGLLPKFEALVATYREERALVRHSPDVAGSRSIRPRIGICL
jgi:glutamine synthetase adenylyltransferase